MKCPGRFSLRAGEASGYKHPPHLKWHSEGQASLLFHPHPDPVIGLHRPWGLNPTYADSNTASGNAAARPTPGLASGVIADESHSRGTSDGALLGLCIGRLSFSTADKHIYVCLQTGALFPRLHFSTTVMMDALRSHEEEWQQNEKHMCHLWEDTWARKYSCTKASQP